MSRRFERLVHYGQLKDGKLVLDNTSWFTGMLSLFDDTKVSVLVERRKNSKSKEQQGYLWGVVYPHIAQYTGYTPEELHDVFKAKFLKKKRKWRGMDMVTVSSTEGLTTGEMAEFITNVVMEAAEMSIVVPDPDKLYQFRH